MNPTALFAAAVEIPGRARGDRSGGDYFLCIFKARLAVRGVARADSGGADEAADGGAAARAAGSSSAEHKGSQVVTHAARYVDQGRTEAEGLLEQILC